MKTTIVLATALALSAVALRPGASQAQAACAITPSVIDSARVDAMTVLFSDRPLLAELRQEQSIPASASQVSVSVVRDGAVCRKLASQLNHVLSPGSKLAVLRVGPLFYARDPDQTRATGIFTDSTLRVVMRLGVAVDR